MNENEPTQSGAVRIEKRPRAHRREALALACEGDRLRLRLTYALAAAEERAKQNHSPLSNLARNFAANADLGSLLRVSTMLLPRRRRFRSFLLYTLASNVIRTLRKK